jgi:hypothetical protein
MPPSPRFSILKDSLIARQWERGLALYYCGRLEEGAEQFARNIEVDRQDAEPVFWKFLVRRYAERGRSGRLYILALVLSALYLGLGRHGAGMGRSRQRTEKFVHDRGISEV